MQKKIIHPIMLLCIFTLMACASSIPLKPEKRVSIRSISINNHVQMPDIMFYRGPEYTLGAFGVVGKFAADITQMKNHQIIKYLMAETDINVAQIVREQFIHEIKGNQIFRTITPEGGDAKISLSVQIYGFAYELSSKLKPMLGVTGNLAQNDAVIWKKYAYVTNLNKTTPPNTLNEFVANPELIREAFEAAARIVVEDLCNHLQGN